MCSSLPMFCGQLWSFEDCHGLAVERLKENWVHDHGRGESFYSFVGATAHRVGTSESAERRRYEPCSSFLTSSFFCFALDLDLTDAIVNCQSPSTRTVCEDESVLDRMTSVLLQSPNGVGSCSREEMEANVTHAQWDEKGRCGGERCPGEPRPRYGHF